MTKGFKESDEGQTFHSTLILDWNAHMTESLDAHIRAKKLEITSIERALQLEQLVDAAKPIIHAEFLKLKDAMKMPDTSMDENGNITILWWVSNPLSFTLAKQVLEDWVMCTGHIITIVQSAMATTEQ